MKKKWFFLWIFMFFSSQVYSEGFRVEARANFMGDAELSLAGTKIVSNPGGSGLESVSGKAKNKFGFSLFTGYEDAIGKQIIVFLGLGFNQYQTEVFNLDNSYDNKSVSGKTASLHLSGQFKFLKSFYIEAGVNFPVLARFEGSFDNETGVDEVDLEGRLSYDFSLGYGLAKNMKVSLGYASVSMRKEKAMTNVDIGLDISHFFLGIAYVF